MIPHCLTNTYSISDTGSTQYYIELNISCTNKVDSNKVPQVVLMYGSFMNTTHKAYINLSPLQNTRANKEHILTHLKSGGLIYIGKIYDDGFTATFTATDLKVNKQRATLLEVHRNGASGMWQVNLSSRAPILMF